MPAVYLNDLFSLAPEDLEWIQQNTTGQPPSQRASMGFAYTADFLFVFGGVNSTGVLCLMWTGSVFEHGRPFLQTVFDLSDGLVG